jgi:hypothetical protein
MRYRWIAVIADIARGSETQEGCGAHFHRQVNEAGFRNREIHT